MIPEDFAEKITFNRTWDLLSHRWKFYVVYLLGERPLRFGELRRLCAAVSRVTLTGYLRQLEREGFVSCRRLSEPALFAEYALTDLGRNALPPVRQLIAWGDEAD